jgi:hypothetical protein
VRVTGKDVTEPKCSFFQEDAKGIGGQFTKDRCFLWNLLLEIWTSKGLKDTIKHTYEKVLRT